MKKYTLFTLLIMIVMISCRKDLEVNSTTETPHTPVIIENYDPIIENVNSSVFGTVVDEIGNPVVDAQITLGNSTKTTGEFGTFEFENVTMNHLGTFVQVEKTGYFLSGRRFYPKEGIQNIVRIELLEKTFDASFESSTGGTINISDNGGTIIFQPNSIRTESGGTYNGTVQVATKYLDPTAYRTFDQMPGALQGVDDENEEVGLITYGMIGVELEGSAGEKLNIADGFTAQVNINLPASIQTVAPSEIPLWSFNYTYGIWVEEGSATLQNGQYVGEVSHFSFWNCDYFADVVEFDVTVVDINNQEPIQGLGVKISLPNGVGSGFAYSNIDGVVSGLLPANEELVLEVLSACGDILYTQNIGPFAADVSLGEIAAAVSIEISGMIMNCDANLVQNGIVILKQGAAYVTYYVDSNPFTIRAIACSSSTEMEFIGGDLDEFQQGNPVIFPVNSTMDVGQIVACGQPLLGYMRLTIDGTTRLFEIQATPLLPDSINPFVMYIRMWQQPNSPPQDSVGGQIGLGVDINMGGVFGTGEYGSLSGGSNGNFIDVIGDYKNDWLFANASGFEHFTITEYGPFYNTEVLGSFSGNLENIYGGQSTQVWVEGDIRFIRIPD